MLDGPPGEQEVRQLAQRRLSDAHDIAREHVLWQRVGRLNQKAAGYSLVVESAVWHFAVTAVLDRLSSLEHTQVALATKNIKRIIREAGRDNVLEEDVFDFVRGRAIERAIQGN